MVCSLIHFAVALYGYEMHLRSVYMVLTGSQVGQFLRNQVD